MAENQCYPSTPIEDPGFALLTDDKWYNAHPIDKQYRGEYAAPPIGIVTQNKVNNPGWRKRWMDPNLDSGEILLNEGNLTRKLTDDGLLEEFETLQCKSQGCEDEKSQTCESIVCACRMEKNRISHTSNYFALDSVVNTNIIKLPMYFLY